MVLRVRPGHVEAVRVVEDLGVAVGRGEQGGDHRAARIGDAGDRRCRLPVRPVSSTGGSSRRISSTAFGHSSGCSRSSSSWSGCCVQQGDAVAEQVDRGLEAGRQHEPGRRLQLAVVEADAVLAARATSWLSRSSPGLSRSVVEVARRARRRTRRRAASTRRNSPPGQPEVEAGRGSAPKREDARAVLGRHAEDLGDHGDRQQAAVALDEVDRVGAVELVEQIGGDLFGAATQLLDCADAEDAGDQLAVARVVGRLGDQQRRRLERSEPLVARWPSRRPPDRAADLAAARSRRGNRCCRAPRARAAAEVVR